MVLLEGDRTVENVRGDDVCWVLILNEGDRTVEVVRRHVRWVLQGGGERWRESTRLSAAKTKRRESWRVSPTCR